MSNSIKIYGVPFSVHTRKVIVACRLKAIPHEVVPVVPIIPEQLPADWRRLSPTGLIPAIDHGGYQLADSTAIIHYLERINPLPALIPGDPRDLGRALFLDAWAGTSLFREVIRPIFHHQVVAPKVEQRALDDRAVEAVLEGAAPQAFAYLETLAPKRHLVGAAFSIADLTVVSNLVMFHYLGHQIDPKRYPSLYRYWAEHLEAPWFRTTVENERPFVEAMGLGRSFLS